MLDTISALVGLFILIVFSCLGVQLLFEHKRDEELYLQKCKDISEIKEELFLIHEHLGDLVDVTIAFDDLEDDNNAQTK